MKADNQKIAMVTAYDYTTARIVDAAGQPHQQRIAGVHAHVR
jgi:ketopantoate hydroxymethyltransferase